MNGPPASRQSAALGQYRGLAMLKERYNNLTSVAITPMAITLMLPQRMTRRYANSFRLRAKSSLVTNQSVTQSAKAWACSSGLPTTLSSGCSERQ
jgi:hypothetical protein